MVQYILLFVTFQILFLIIYDVFLKRETFFQWNRVYLIGTFLVSLFLPFVKLAAFATVVPEQFSVIVLQEIILTPNTSDVASNFSIFQLLFYTGMAISVLVFGFKIHQIVKLKRQGELQQFSDYTKVTVAKSNLAFSFYDTVFIGDAVDKTSEKGILEHELVHIRQKHSLDLLFFEILRIVFWFNPLVYVYQNRIAELHEFIADDHAGKDNRSEQYELLLSQIFQTKNISFINHFYKSSLIKKRIVMLQKSKSSTILKFKYLALVPLITGMLFYTSCETEPKEQVDEVIEIAVDVPFSVVETPPVFPGCENAEDVRACFNEQMNKHIRKNFKYPEIAQQQGVQGKVNIRFVIQKDGSIGQLQMRGPDKNLEKEAARIISLLPKMTAGMQRGTNVRVPFSLPITFRLQ
ncbi:M56 family metallopeptidase [Cellulophaga sp. F20128]|uniref:M56 family metallopeptidase n=1 Tax=Cellulophaga sp. F20128 TaxID=2926413 RepID=UPI001FF514B4|nr:M56 family metallopeptidase [Cellulophaga sp. F20128]MCK0158067.1 M56 family metallopeptidase [Cellulophaga sp. F20128]